MESKHKNALIGALLAVVFVMAVGYAAFATTLTINGTAEITTNWDVHFDPAVKTATPTIGAGAGTTAQDPTGTISLSADNLTATLTANLKQPGDKVVYTLQPKNFGTITAKASTPVVSIGGSKADSTADPATTGSVAEAEAAKAADTWDSANNKFEKTVNNIKYTVEFEAASSIAGGESDGLVTVTVEYVYTADTVAPAQAAALTVTIPYAQA